MRNEILRLTLQIVFWNDFRRFYFLNEWKEDIAMFK